MIASARHPKTRIPPVLAAALAIYPRPDPRERILDLIDRAHAEIGARLAAQRAMLARLEVAR